MAALRFLGGDAAVGLGLTVDELVAPLEAGLRLAADLGDRRAEADFTSRLAILEASRLRLATALARAEGGLVRARSAGSEDAQVLALDGLKTVWAYLGDPVRLGEVDRRPRAAAPGPRRHVAAPVDRVREVVRARRRGSAGTTPGPWSPRRWSSTGSAATRRTPATCTPTTAGSPGWPATWTTARRVGREAVEASSPIDHPWWYAIAAGLLAATLIETGDAAEAEAVAAARAGDRRGGDGRRPAALPGGTRGPDRRPGADGRGAPGRSTPSSARPARPGSPGPTSTCCSAPSSR